MFSTTTTYTALTAALFAATSFTAPTTSSSSYSLVADFSGSSFFDGFEAFVAADPTEGNVNYVGMKYGAEAGLLGLIDNQATGSTNAYIGVDYQNVTANRNSIRLSSKATFDAGTVITFDVVHAPVAYGTWPALWLLGAVPGSVWPDAGGEADILEWVHETPYNSMTLHTAPGCSVDNSSSAFQGELQENNCNTESGSTGCSIQALSQDTNSGKTLATAGKAFNDQGGAVYAVDWSATGLSVFMFARDSLPADLTAGKPDPSSWTGKPLAQFSGSGCDYSSSLSTMQIIEDITFCGQWAGKVWESSGAAAATNTATCAAYVQNNPKAFKDAYFEIASIKVYSESGTQPGTAWNTKRDAEPEQLSLRTININDRYTDTDGAEAQPRDSESTKDTAPAAHHGHHHRHVDHSAHPTGTHTGVQLPQSTASLASTQDKEAVSSKSGAAGGGGGLLIAASHSAANTNYQVTSADVWAAVALIAVTVAALI